MDCRNIEIFKPIINEVVKGKPKSLLVIEFAEDNMDENISRLKQLNILMKDIGYSWKNTPKKIGGVVDILDNKTQSSVTEMRKSGLNIMMSMKDEAKPVSFVEDCAVELTDLAEVGMALIKFLISIK